MSIRGNRRIRRAWHTERWGRFYYLWREHRVREDVYIAGYKARKQRMREEGDDAD